MIITKSHYNSILNNNNNEIKIFLYTTGAGPPRNNIFTQLPAAAAQE